MVPTPPPQPIDDLFRSAKRVKRLEGLLPLSWRVRLFARRERRVREDLVKAIRAYWSVNQDPRAVGRQDRRRFSRELADLIADHIGR